jgi:hypothetical protein
MHCCMPEAFFTCRLATFSFWVYLLCWPLHFFVGDSEYERGPRTRVLAAAVGTNIAAYFGPRCSLGVFELVTSSRLRYKY